MNLLVILAIDAVAIYFKVKLAWFRNCLLVISILAVHFFYYNDFQQRKENEIASIIILPEQMILSTLILHLMTT